MTTKVFALVTRILQIAMGQNNSRTVTLCLGSNENKRWLYNNHLWCGIHLSATLSCLDGGVNTSLSLSLPVYTQVSDSFRKSTNKWSISVLIQIHNQINKRLNNQRKQINKSMSSFKLPTHPLQITSINLVIISKSSPSEIQNHFDCQNNTCFFQRSLGPKSK